MADQLHIEPLASPIASVESTLVDAVNLALHHEMGRDKRVVLLGEDVAITAAYSAPPLALKNVLGLNALSIPHLPKHSSAVLR